MTEARRCPQCNAELADDAPEGLCPACLLRQAATIPPSDAAGVGSVGSAVGSGTPAGKSSTSPYQRFIPPTPAELAPLFPQLEIIELLGQGGMGAVYKARQPGLDRLVALKVLPREIGGDPAFAERFTREARALAKLNHPHIVTVYDFGQTARVPPGGSGAVAVGSGLNEEGAGVEISSPFSPGGRGAGGEGGLYYFVMEYVDGLDLRQMLRSGQMSPRDVLAIIPQMCEALQFAHDEGVVHRDIKPENVLLDKRGRVKIADFGLAKLVGQAFQPDGGGRAVSQERLTHTGQVMGTFHYMAPEQMERPQEVDHRADIYALGVVFYEMLTGQLPLGRFAPPSQKVQIDVRLDDVVFRALEREPERRYQHASDVKTDVETIVRDPKRAPPPPAARAVDVDFDAAQEHVQGPAIALLSVGVLTSLFSVFGPAVALTGRSAWEAVLLILFLPTGIITSLSGWKMRSLEWYTFAVLGALLALVAAPLSVIGLPIGIWALVVLNKSEIKAAFSGNVGQPSRPAQPRPPLMGDAALEYARRRVQRPAIGLIVVGSLLLLLDLLLGAYALIALSFMMAGPEVEGRRSAQDTTLWVVFMIALFVVVVLVAALSIVAGIKMRQVKMYGLAVSTAIVIMAACLCVPIPGIVTCPIGIWALVVLANRDVRAGFAHQARTTVKPAGAGEPPLPTTRPA